MGEGKISQVSIGNIREVLAVLSDMLYADAMGSDDPGRYQGLYPALFRNGERRSKRKPKGRSPSSPAAKSRQPRHRK